MGPSASTRLASERKSKRTSMYAWSRDGKVWGCVRRFVSSRQQLSTPIVHQYVHRPIEVQTIGLSCPSVVPCSCITSHLGNKPPHKLHICEVPATANTTQDDKQDNIQYGTQQ